MNRMHKFLTIIISVLIIGILLLNYLLPRMIIQVNSGIYSVLRPLDKSILLTPDMFDLKSEKLSVKTKDNLKLSAYLIKTDSLNQKGTILLIHGIRAYKEHYLPLCKMLADSGYNSVIIDLRAHGESEGEYCTFGFYEKQDLSILIDSLSLIKNLNTNYGIWGQSLGGAIALQILATDKRLKFGVIESTFSDFRTIVHDYFKKRMGFDIPFITNYLIWRAERIAHFNASEVMPCNSAKKILQPVFIAHGSMDDRINISYGKLNFNNIKAKQKEFFECPYANHINLWTKCKENYFEKVFDFLNKLNSTLEK